MALSENPAPQECTEQVQTWLAAQGATQSPILVVGDEAPETYAHQVYQIDVSDVISGKGIVNAKPVAWRLIVEDERARLATAQVQTTGASSPGGAVDGYQFTFANYGPHVQKMKQYMIDESESGDDIKYEAALLDLFFMGMSFAWFRTEDHKDDYLIAFEPVFYGFEANKRYTPDDVSNQLLALFKKVMGKTKKKSTHMPSGLAGGGDVKDELLAGHFIIPD